ncbi:hypothetical protein [Collimonas pratensis]|uniref:Uncharacterized protein n=1 Tax=Collimonas pratensis TaxID=279113 RepID=A0ABM5Z8M7_9BURK|nr:hypothetical protein [Collimonas pratensis]AMP15515.1 hypothetical protein CPter291_3278 [Collimonas pratensis]
MSTFQVAHIREQGQDMIIIPLDSGFNHKSSAEQNQIIAELQACASSAGLAGTVVAVWRVGSSHKFIAPRQWQEFFKSFSWNDIVRNVNKDLTCG